MPYRILIPCLAFFVLLAAALACESGPPPASLAATPSVENGVTPALSSPQADEWAAVRAADVARVPEGWSAPVYLGVNNLGGWIDSLEVSSDGQIIRYVFYPGPDLITDVATGDLKGDADIYMSEWPFETHQPVNKYFTNEVPWSACCIHVDAGGNYWYNSNREAREGGSAEGDFDWHALFRNDQIAPFHQRGEEMQDVFYCAAKDELWVVMGQTGIGILSDAQADNFTGTPQRLPDPLGAGGQPFLTADCNTLYFSANFGDTPGQGPVIYTSDRVGGEWSPPEPLIWGETGVGEPTVTADGKQLFFVQLFQNREGEFRIAAFYTETGR
jgi:hypothetical protein